VLRIQETMAYQATSHQVYSPGSTCQHPWCNCIKHYNILNFVSNSYLFISQHTVTEKLYRNVNRRLYTILQRDRAACSTDSVTQSTYCDAIGLQSHEIQWKKTQNKGYYAVQGHSRSPRSVPIDSAYATSY